VAGFKAPASRRTAETLLVIAPQDIQSLIERHTTSLMRAAFSLNFNESEAEELVQATFCAYLDGGHRYEKRSQLLTYLFGILYNKARETRRRRDRYDSLDAIEEKFESHFDAEDHWDQPSMEAMTEVEKQVQSSALGALLKECLEGLTDVMAMAFTLKEVEGVASAQICTILDITPSHLGVTLFRARNKLRDCLMAKGAVLV
jgi:RNA polymerase sigma-70 factor (ECF subfamily)